MATASMSMEEARMVDSMIESTHQSGEPSEAGQGGTKRPQTSPSSAANPRSAPSSDAGQAGPLGVAFYLLEQLEAQREGSGGLTFCDRAGRPVGTAMISTGRLCFVGGTQGTPRLAELLCAQDPERAAVVKRAIARAAADKRLLGEVLVEAGETALEQVRQCLLQQISMALNAVATQFEPTACTAHFTPLPGSYDPRLTFGLAEIYRHVAERHLPDIGGAASELYTAFADSAALAMLCTSETHDPGTPLLPLRIAGRPPADMRGLRRLVNTANRLARPAALSAAGVEPQVLMAGSADDTAITLREGSTVCLLAGLSGHARVRALSVAANLCEVADA